MKAFSVEDLTIFEGLQVWRNGIPELAHFGMPIVTKDRQLEEYSEKRTPDERLYLCDVSIEEVEIETESRGWWQTLIQRLKERDNNVARFRIIPPTDNTNGDRIVVSWVVGPESADSTFFSGGCTVLDKHISYSRHYMLAIMCPNDEMSMFGIRYDKFGRRENYHLVWDGKQIHAYHDFDSANNEKVKSKVVRVFE